jgi:protein-tyrosine phosphatase
MNSNFLSSLTAFYKVCKDKYYSYNTCESDTSERVFKDNNLFDQYYTFIDTPTHIIDNIYIGSAYNAANYNSLNYNNIGLIINMTTELTHHYTDKYIYKKFSINDNNKDDIDNYLEETFNEIINYNKYNNKNILIHCFVGRSRSVSVVIYYLMKKHLMSFDQAINYIKNKRPIINPNNKFVETLKKKENI